MRTKLPPGTKVFIGPYRPKGETGKQFVARVYKSQADWASDHDFALVMVDGLQTELLHYDRVDPHSLSDLMDHWNTSVPSPAYKVAGPSTARRATCRFSSA